MALDMARHTAMMLRRAPDSVRVVWGSLVTYGTFRSAGDLEAVDGGFVPTTTRTILLARNALPGLLKNAIITIGSTAYKVHSPPLSVENDDLVRFLVVPVT
jgi:hypothetical protein